MAWRIRENAHGEFVAEYGMRHDGGVQISAIGATMPAFIVYRSINFETKKKAESYIAKNPCPLGIAVGGVR